MQLRLGQTWEWPGTHSVSRGCPCACLCQSPNGKTALPWSPGRTSARLQTPAPQSPRWKHAACCGGGGGRRRKEGGGGGEGGGYGATVQWFTYTLTAPTPLSLAHQIVCVIQRLPAISTVAYGPNEIQCQMGEGTSPIGFPPSQRCSSGYNLKKGAPGLNVSLTSHWCQCFWHVHSCSCPLTSVLAGRWAWIRGNAAVNPADSICSRGPCPPPTPRADLDWPCFVCLIGRAAGRHVLRSARPGRDSLVAHSLDSLGGTLIVVLLHVAVHGAKLHLPPEVDIHGALLHRGVDELVGWVSQLHKDTRTNNDFHGCRIYTICFCVYIFKTQKDFAMWYHGPHAILYAPLGHWCRWCAPQAGPTPGRLPGWQYKKPQWSWQIRPTPYPGFSLRSCAAHLCGWQICPF